MIGYSRAFNELYGPKPIEGKFKMNERIQELKKQCYRVEDPEGLFPREVFDEEKFAELLVRECARVAAQTLCPYEDECSRTTFGHTWDMACVESAREIKQHFGVEE